jgi:hypothetical protein
MNHVPYIAGSYALGVLIPGGFAAAAWRRVRRAARRLRAIDPRGLREGRRG